MKNDLLSLQMFSLWDKVPFESELHVTWEMIL